MSRQLDDANLEPKAIATIREVSTISILSARDWNAQPREAMISITGTGEPRARLKRGWSHVLRLTFDDIEEPRLGGKLFSEEDADRVISFLDRIEGKVDHVIAHCRLGLSRAPAIVKFISERYDLGDGFRNARTFNRHVYETLTLNGKGGRICSAKEESSDCSARREAGSRCSRSTTISGGRF